MLKTARYSYKPLQVDAVQVTDANMAEVATWCGGEVQRRAIKALDGQKKNFIKVGVHRPANTKQTEAFEGDWVLRTDKGFRIYTDAAFTRCFHALDSL